MPLPSTSSFFRCASLCVFALLGSLLSSCESKSTSVVVWNFTGTVWNVVEIDGEMLPVEKIPNVQFEPNGTRVVGFTGINKISGGYTLKDGHLSIGLSVSTRMAGPENQMKAEVKFLQMLEKVTGYETKGPWLAFKAGDQVIARAQALPAQPFPPK
ncbi:MAG TPA: META domain-containing protein [Candidatus Didemnitutus sp.]|nr:META domain-containing protein [Candidatus Didemnitutus sp.]